MTAFNPASLPGEEHLHWLSRKDWPNGISHHSAAIVAVFLWIFTIGWCGLTGIIAYVNAEKIAAAMRASATEWIVPSLVVLVALGALIASINTTISWLRYGRTTLALQTLPAFTGETFQGELQAGANILGRRPFKVTVQCEEVKQKMKSVGKGFRKRRKHDHFIRTKLASRDITLDRAAQAGPSGSVLPISIDIPRGAPGSLHRENGTGYQWTLLISTDDGQTPVFSAAFEIPVYRREDLAPV